MGNNKHTEHKQQKTSTKVPPPVPPPIDPSQPPPNPERKKDKDAKQMSKSEKIMVWATCVIAAGTLVSAGAICFQWYEMHHSESRNRPWVGVEDDVAFHEQDISWVGSQGQAMVKKMESENKLPIRILYPIKNSGSGPAFNTMLVIQPLMRPQNAGDAEPRIHALIEKSCQIAEEGITHGNGDLVLPGGEHTVPYTFGNWDSTQFLFTPGCIAYRDIDGGLHHTRICYAAALFVSPTPKVLESCQDQSAD